MKKLLLIFALCLTPLIYGQQVKIDSLRNELKNVKADTSRFRVLKEIAKETFRQDNDRYLEIADSLTTLAQKINDDLYIGQAFSIRGRHFHQSGDFTQAREHYFKALPLFVNGGDSLHIATTYQNIGVTYSNEGNIDSAKAYLKRTLTINTLLDDKEGMFLGNYNLGVQEYRHDNYEKGIEYIIKALAVAEDLKHKRYIAYCQSMIGVIYLEQEQYENAKKHLTKSLNSFTDLEDYSNIGTQQINLGKLYNESENDYIKAISYYKKALFNFEKIGANRSVGIAKGNIGRNYIKLQKIDSASIFINSSLELAKSTNNNSEITRLLQNMGEIELLKGNFVLAKKNVNKSLASAKEFDFIEEYGDGLILLSEINSKEGNYNQAYNNYSKGKHILDSITSVEKLEAISNIQTKYQTEKTEKENLELKAQDIQQELALEKESRQKWIFGLGLIGVALLSLILYRKFTSERKAKNVIAEQKATIEDLQKELHHRVKNNLGIINRFISVMKEDTDDSVSVQKLSDLQNRISSINEVHQQLYIKEDIANLNAKEYIKKLASNVQDSFSQNDINVTQNIDDSLTLNASTSFPVGLIINEFLTNSYKYAFENGKGKINISLQETSKTIALSLSDNGKGLPRDSNTQKTSFGMRIMKLLSQQLDGTFSLDGSNGVNLKIEFPKQ